MFYVFSYCCPEADVRVQDLTMTLQYYSDHLRGLRVVRMPSPETYVDAMNWRMWNTELDEKYPLDESAPIPYFPRDVPRRGRKALKRPAVFKFEEKEDAKH